MAGARSHRRRLRHLTRHRRFAFLDRLERFGVAQVEPRVLHLLAEARVIEELRERRRVCAAVAAVLDEDPSLCTATTNNNGDWSRPAGNDMIVYVREGKLLAQRIDAAKGVAIQEPFAIAENVLWFP